MGVRRFDKRSRKSCVVYRTPSDGGGSCFVDVSGQQPAEARTAAGDGREAYFGLAVPRVAAVRYHTRYGPDVAETRAVPGYRLRYFIAMHDEGVVGRTPYPSRSMPAAGVFAADWWDPQSRRGGPRAGTKCCPPEVPWSSPGCPAGI